MKKTVLIFISLMSMGGLFAQNLTLDEVLAQYFKTIGQEKFSKVQTMKLTGKISQMGMDMTMSIIKKRPNLSRTEVDVQGTKIIYAVNGDNGWMIMPFTGSTEPQDMPEEQLASAKKEDMDGPFVNFKEKGNQLELVGKEDVDGSPAYNIKLITKDGESSNYFIDAAKFLLVKSKAQVMSQGQLANVETKFSDFRETNGMQNPFKVETIANGQQGAEITFESIEYDIPVDNSIFAKPVAK